MFLVCEALGSRYHALRLPHALNGSRTSNFCRLLASHIVSFFSINWNLPFASAGSLLV